MIRKILFCIFVLIVIYILYPVIVYGELKWSLKPEIEIQSDYIAVVDLDDDGSDELLVKIDYRNIVRDQKGVIVKQIDFPDANYRYLEEFKLDQDTVKTLIFQRNSGCTLTAHIWRNSIIDDFLVATGQDLHPPAGWRCFITHVFDIDVNKDGYDDLLCFVSTPYELQPRGIFVYDIQNSREIWHFWMGGVSCLTGIRKENFTDLDNDGEIDITIGTVSPCNGSFANGIDDYHSYVVSINGRGELTWKRKVGEESTIVRTWRGDIDGDSTIEIVACVNEGLLENKEPNSMFILDAVSGDIERYINTGEKFLGLEVCDLDRDGKSDIVSGNSDGKIRVFDEFLSVINERDFSNSVKVLAACDFDCNGTMELLATTRDGKVYMLNEKLELILEEKMEQTVSWLQASIINYGKEKRILFRIGEKRPFTYRLMSVLPLHPISNSPRLLVTCIFCFFAFCALCFALFTSVRSARKYRRAAIVADSISQGILVLDTEDRIVYANKFARDYLTLRKDKIGRKKINEILDTEKYAPLLNLVNASTVDEESIEFSLKKDGEEVRVKSTIVSRGSEKVLIIEDISEKETRERIISWAGIAQKLAHEIKNPLSTVTLTLQRLQKLYKKDITGSTQKLDVYADSILEEIERLRSTTDKFMKMLSIEEPVFEPNDLNEIVKDVLVKYEKVLPKGIVVKTDLNHELPLLRCDRNQMLILFSNLIENGIEALKGEGVLSIETTFIERLEDKVIRKFVEIRIEDTGEGVAEDEVNKLFMPFYSTKEGGTGLGLVFAKQIVEIHGGKIEIESRNNVGTIVSIVLPARD